VNSYHRTANNRGSEMRLFRVVSRTLLVGFTKSPSHHGEPKPLLKFHLAAIWHGELHGAPDDLRVPVSHKVDVGIEVPVEVFNAVEFRTVPAARYGSM